MPPEKIIMFYSKGITFCMVKDLQPRIVSQDYKDNGDIVMTIAIRLSLVERVHSAFIVNGQSLVKVEEC